jgi:hypothetical protein
LTKQNKTNNHNYKILLVELNNNNNNNNNQNRINYRAQIKKEIGLKASK